MRDRSPVGSWVEALSLEDLERRFLFRLLFPRHLLETGTCDFSSSARYLFPDRGSRRVPGRNREAEREGEGRPSADPPAKGYSEIDVWFGGVINFLHKSAVSALSRVPKNPCMKAGGRETLRGPHRQRLTTRTRPSLRALQVSMKSHSERGPSR